MALIIVVLAAIVLFLVAPLMSVLKYYRLARHGFMMNLFWIVVGLITWPLLPFILAVRRRDTKIITMFWVAFIIWMLATSYWLATNAALMQQLQQAQQQLVI